MTPVILYNSAGVPIGPRAIVQFYRPTNTLNAATGAYEADVIAAGAEGNPVGDPVAIEGLSISFNGTPVGQNGTYGEPLDNESLVRGSPTLNIDTFIKSNGTPTLLPGDYCNLNIGMKITSTAATPVPIPSSRWFIPSNGIATNGANKNSAQLRLDRPNSDPTLSEF